MTNKASDMTQDKRRDGLSISDLQRKFVLGFTKAQELRSFIEAREKKMFEETEKPLKEALDFAKAAIEDAIYSEDGLDGATGQAVIRIIDDALATFNKYKGE